MITSIRSFKHGPFFFGGGGGGGDISRYSTVCALSAWGGGVRRNITWGGGYVGTSHGEEGT